MHKFYSFSTQTPPLLPSPVTPKRTHPILKLIDERFKNKFVRGVGAEEGFD
jgi:hypothetical protein